MTRRYTKARGGAPAPGATRVLMLHTTPVSLDGHKIVHWMRGKEYDCPVDLIGALIDLGAVRIVGNGKAKGGRDAQSQKRGSHHQRG